MKFTVFFEIYPPGAFGLPDGPRTVLPAGPREFTGDIFHRTGIRVGYGTLSNYRDERDAIDLDLQLGNINGKLKDNYLSLDVETASHSEAYIIAKSMVARFIQHLSVSLTRLFTCKAILITDERGGYYDIPRFVIMSSVQGYNLSLLRDKIKEAEKAASLTESLLNKALHYYEHALFLFENRAAMTDIFSPHMQYLISAAFLNLWKAVSSILGDPSCDKDYQKRYKMLGLSCDFFRSDVEFVRKVRNSYDVAHYHISEDGFKEIERHFGKAAEVATCVLHAYRQYLLSGNPPLSPSR